MGESKRFHALGVGDPEGRNSSGIMLPFGPTDIDSDSTPLSDETMVGEFSMLFMMPLVFSWLCCTIRTFFCDLLLNKYLGGNRTLALLYLKLSAKL